MILIKRVTRSSSVRLAIGVLSISLWLAPSALAASPQSEGGTAGTGINIDPRTPRSAEALGYSDAMAADKVRAASLRVTARGVLDARTDSTALPGRSAIAVANPDAAPLIPTSGSLLAWWHSYHQKTTYNCLPAVGQSMLGSNFPAAGYTAPTVAAKQGTAAQQAGTIAKGMHTTTTGTDDYNALAYVNGQYAAQGSSWFYVHANFTDEGSFKSRIEDEIWNLDNATYVRVDLTNANYAWHQATPAQHATAAVAYSNSGSNTTIDDPFTHLSGSTCVATPYSSTNDQSCNWVNYSTHKYFLAKDVVRGGEDPMWW
jgi:hypothetical protein